MPSNRKKPNRVMVYLTEQEDAMLTQISEESGYSKTELMRQLLLDYGDTFRNKKPIAGKPIAA